MTLDMIAWIFKVIDGQLFGCDLTLNKLEEKCHDYFDLAISDEEPLR